MGGEIGDKPQRRPAVRKKDRLGIPQVLPIPGRMHPLGVLPDRPGIHRVEAGGKWGWWKTSKGGFRADLGREYRSSWEANIHRLLNWFKENKVPLTGKHISFETVYVEFNHRRGGPSGYHPDFVLYMASSIRVDGKTYHKTHIEITGFRDRKKQLKMQRLIEDYGNKNGIMMIEITEDIYYMLEQSYSSVIPNWELSGKYLKEQENGRSGEEGKVSPGVSRRRDRKQRSNRAEDGTG